jgi:SAM-dependent methyltransferase
MSPSRWRLRLARFLRVKPICNAVFWLRFFWYARLKRQVRAYQDESGVRAHDYSMDKIQLGRPTDRILRLIRPLASIDALNEDSSVLSIGCRFETDLLYLVGYGFRPDRVRGMDMISYSPWIDLGNMHAMTYADSSWDCTVLGWVLAYSDTPQKACDELVRITRPGGLIALGITYYPPDEMKKLAARGAPGARADRIQTTEAVLELFKGHVDRLYFRHDPADPAKQGSCMVIFSVRK